MALVTILLSLLPTVITDVGLIRGLIANIAARKGMDVDAVLAQASTTLDADDKRALADEIRIQAEIVAAVGTPS